MSRITFSLNERGFRSWNFKDRNGAGCSMQKSSLATEDCIWLGVDDAEPQIMASVAIRLGLKPIEGGEKDNGWVPFEVPKEVLMTTRMHLTRKQVSDLLPILDHFAKTGTLPKSQKPLDDDPATRPEASLTEGKQAPKENDHDSLIALVKELSEALENAYKAVTLRPEIMAHSNFRTEMIDFEWMVTARTTLDKVREAGL